MKSLVYCIICPPHWIKTPPIGLEFIRKYNQTKNITVKVLDLNILFYRLLGIDKKRWLSLNKNFEDNLFSMIKEKYPLVIKNILKKLKNADIVGFSLFERNKNFTYKFIEEIKCTYPQKKIVVGGPEVLFMKIRGQSLRKSISWVIGEGERALEKILGSKEDIVITNSELENLDEIPFLDFENFNMGLYSQILPLYSSRGCIKSCNFCTERLLSPKFRQHSPFYMIDQIKLLVNKFKTNYFTFQDSLINANPNWLYQFLNLISEKGLKINWEAQIIVREDFDYNLAKLFKKSGCFNLFVGLESASDRVLESMNKKFTKDQAINFFNILKKAGIHYEISLIIGYPTETENDFKETVRFIIKNKAIIPKIAQINPYIDYFSSNYVPSQKVIERVNYLISILERERIPYTRGFINNLWYQNGN
jgi:radical SAM superfamily enzyme YgiQ (UPF0313 family)